MTTSTGTDLSTLETGLLSDIAGAGDLAQIEAVRVAALGKKGRISELMATLGKLPPEERKTFGASVNTVKTRITEALDARKAELDSAALSERLATERADITLPVRSGPEALGRIHPVSQVFDECVEIFADMGFSVAEGPDIETDEMNFDKLNIPAEHPARQDHDTFYFNPRP
ncbi:MAG: phenylalanine--tRNA ligase subunit alpha, partial [Hyphomicrobium sp.]